LQKRRIFAFKIVENEQKKGSFAIAHQVFCSGLSLAMVIFRLPALDGVNKWLLSGCLLWMELTYGCYQAACSGWG